MVDQDPSDRETKLLAARKKLKKFQSRKLANHDNSETQFSSSQEQPPLEGAVGVLFTNYDSPLVKSKSDDIQNQPMDSHNLDLHNSQPAVNISSPPQAIVDTHQTMLSPAQQLPATSPSQKSTTMDSQQQNNTDAFSTLSQQLEQELVNLKAQVDQVHQQKVDSIHFLLQSLVGKHHMLELDYHRLLEHNTTIQTHQSKVADMELALEIAQNQPMDDHHQWVALVDTLKKKMVELEASNLDFQAETTRLIDMVNDLEDTLAKTQADNYAKDCELGELQAALLEKNDAAFQQAPLDHDTDKLEQQLVNLQQLLESKTRDHSELVMNKDDLQVVIKDLERKLDTRHIKDDDNINTLVASAQYLEQQHTSMKQQLVEATRQVEDNEKTLLFLRDQIYLLEQDRDQLHQQLHECQEALAIKGKALETSTANLEVLHQQYAELEQTVGEKESLYADLLEIKNSMEQQLVNVTSENDATSLEQQQAVLDKVTRIKHKIDRVTTLYDGIEQKAVDIDMLLTARQQERQCKQSDWDNNIAAQHDQVLLDLDNKRTELDTIQQLLKVSESQAKSHADKLTDMESRALEHQLHISKLETDQHMSEEKGRFLEEQLKMVQDELDGQRQVVERLQEEKSRLEARLESSHNNLEAQQTLVDTLNTQLEDRAEKIEQLDAHIKRLESGMENGDGWQVKYQALDQQFKAQEKVVMEKETVLDDMRATLVQLEAHATDLEQQLTLERANGTTTGDYHQLSLNDKSTPNNGDDLIQQQDKINSLETQLTALQQQYVEQTQLYDEKVAANSSKYENMERLLEHTRHQWMMEQTKVANMTEEISQLRWQLQHQVKDQQTLQRRLDETKQLLANRDQNTEALQWQVTDMESSVRYQVDQLNGQLKEAQEQLIEKSRLVDQLQQQLMAVNQNTSSPTITDVEHPSSDDQPKELSPTITTSEHPSSSDNQPKEPSSPSIDPPSIDQPSPDSESALEIEVKELRQRLERQFDAFTTIRGELTTVRDRHLNAELVAQKEKESLLQEKKEMELTIERLRTEYQEHLEHMWAQHQAMREHHEEDLTLGRDALDAAQVKLMQNGLSPVSENGFEWVNTDSEDDDNDNEKAPADKSPLVGQLPPLQKPAFFEFSETPRCSGCQTEVIEI
ncbi:hypothetical protein BC941DRAFT_432368 [Chlamydoabsidia padenii]|nr:hypothetical protein BC941DRAFT_432368 [Chlamydoabsidia padenii]